MFFNFCQPFIRVTLNKKGQIPFPWNRLRSNKNFIDAPKPDLDGENDEEIDNYTFVHTILIY